MPGSPGPRPAPTPGSARSTPGSAPSTVDSRPSTARFSRVDARFAQLEAQLDRSLREQTRTLTLGLIGAMFTMTSLCLGSVALAA